jgi:uncharacterized protein
VAEAGRFLDRERELAWLAEGWPPGSPGRAELRILYGRRRVGKSALLDEFARGKRHVLFQAVEGTPADQLRDLTAAVLACEDDPVLRAAPLANWDAALAHLSRMAAAGPLLVIFDEFQYVAEADPTLASRLQRWWSREAVRLPLYLVLCGSYVRFFVKNVLTGPAYGRNTGAWQLTPLGYRQAAEFYAGWSAEDKVRAYAVAGGVPHYLEQLDPGRSLAWNVANRLLRRGAVLYQEAELLMREELREPRLYFSILRAIVDGCTRVREITERVRPFSSSTDITPYLYTLQELGLVEYRQPVVGRAARRGVWTVVDPYLRAWFRFVLPNQGRLEHGGDPEQVYRAAVAPALDEFVSRPAFEEICRSWVLGRAIVGTPGFAEIERVGAWWGAVPQPTAENPRRQGEGEIEVVAAAGGRVVLLGEAKWSREPIGFGVLNHLREVAKHVPGTSPTIQLVLFGRSFDPRLEKAAESEGVWLVSTDTLYAPDTPFPSV